MSPDGGGGMIEAMLVVVDCSCLFVKSVCLLKQAVLSMCLSAEQVFVG